ncbi:MAG: DUF2127 domain-containing protein [Acidobacteriaceae bacterium]
MKFLSHSAVLRFIAIFKFAKAILFLLVAAGALKMMHQDVGDALEHWAQVFGLDPDGRVVGGLIQKASGLTPGHLKAVSVASVIYSSVFFTEGIGLWLLKLWAEWLTVIVTASLVPLEVYEIYRHATPLKFVVLVINVVIVVYLIARIRDKSGQKNAGH